jgi:hypothetical protein
MIETISSRKVENPEDDLDRFEKQAELHVTEPVAKERDKHSES